MWVNEGKGDDIPQTNYAHRRSVEPIRPQVSWNVCKEPTKMPTSLGAGLYCCCLIAWAVVHRNGALRLFSFFPWWQLFSHCFTFLFPKWFLLFCLLHQFLEALVISKSIVSLLNFVWQTPWAVPETQYYLAIRIMVEKVSVGSCVKAVKRWPCCPRKLENRDSGVRIQALAVSHIHMQVL